VVNAIDANIRVNARTKLLVISPTEKIIANSVPLEMSERLRQETKNRLNDSCVRNPNVDSDGDFIALRIFFKSTIDEI
jgi:hypothetical protein